MEKMDRKNKAIVRKMMELERDQDLEYAMLDQYVISDSSSNDSDGPENPRPKYDITQTWS